LFISSLFNTISLGQKGIIVDFSQPENSEIVYIPYIERLNKSYYTLRFANVDWKIFPPQILVNGESIQPISATDEQKKSNYFVDLDFMSNLETVFQLDKIDSLDISIYLDGKTYM